jgi:glutathione S-transferase
MLGKKIGIEFNQILVDLLKGEQNKPEFVALNPEHTVPTIVDHETGLVLWESRAILSYLVDKYAPGNSVYPQDPVKRAHVDRWLYFDCGTLMPAGRDIIRPLIFAGKEPEAEKLAVLDEKLKLMDTLLVKDGKKFVAGDELTIADLALVASLDMPVYLIGLDLSKHPNVHAWYERVKQTAEGYEEICGAVMKGFKAKIDEKNAGK